MSGYELDSFGLGKSTAEGSCEHGNECLGFIRVLQFLDQLRYCQARSNRAVSS
jgi:hypothetical protein